MILRFLAPLILTASLQAADTKWNVVVILADDLGWTDLGCYGSDFYETPNIDRLAKSGMKFTQNYSACTVCSPTRSALLTGKYPARMHITDWIPGLMPQNPKLLVPDWSKQLPTTETSLAKVFQSAGYATASIGKWHLGGPEFFPEKHGFDINIAGINAGAPPTYFSPWKIPTLQDGNNGDYLTDRLAEETERVIEKLKKKPFFLYLPHFAVHLPLQAKKDLIAKYKAKKPGENQSNAVYAAMIESLDAAVGRVMAALAKHNLAERTVVVFVSDNGGRVPTTSNKPLRVGKGSAYEGGTRVPLIVHWPGMTKSGSVCEVPTITMDLFSTVLEIAGLQVPPATSPTGPSGRDGVSLVPLLKGGDKLERQNLFWHYPHHQWYQQGGTMPYSAIRSGDFKLIEFFNDGKLELYNLRQDISESNILTKANPERVQELHTRLKKWREEVGAQMPVPNPQYDPSKPEFLPKSK